MSFWGKFNFTEFPETLTRQKGRRGNFLIISKVEEEEEEEKKTSLKWWKQREEGEEGE